MPAYLLEPKVEILHGFGSYTRVINKSIVYEEKPVRAFVSLRVSNKSSIKVGFAITRDITRTVDRNRLKRYLRRSFQLSAGILKKNMEVRRTIEVVFMYISGSKGFSRKNARFFTIAQAINKICNRIQATYGE